MTGQQRYLRMLARRRGLFYCANCGDQPPVPDRSLCERCLTDCTNEAWRAEASERASAARRLT